MKPQDFFVSVRELFAILIPGIIFLSAMENIKSALFEQIYRNHSPMSQANLPYGTDIIVMLAAAYAIGTVIYGVGSLLDDGYEMIGKWLRRPEKRLLFDEFEQIATDAKMIKLAALFDEEKLQTIKWSNKSFWSDRIIQLSPEGASQLEKIEATQKFFRSICVVFFILFFFNLGMFKYVDILISISFFACFGLYLFFRGESEYRLLKWVALCQVDQK